jgi:hypothetical protein
MDFTFYDPGVLRDDELMLQLKDAQMDASGVEPVRAAIRLSSSSATSLRSRTIAGAKSLRAFKVTKGADTPRRLRKRLEFLMGTLRTVPTTNEEPPTASYRLPATSYQPRPLTVPRCR